MRFAIIGCGETGSRRAAAIDAAGGAGIAVCVDATEDRASELASRFGVDASTNWQGYMSVIISGTDGFARIDYDESTITLGFRPGVPGAGLGGKMDLSGAPDRSLETEVQELMAAVKENREPDGGGQDGLEALILAQAIYNASDEDNAVKV